MVVATAETHRAFRSSRWWTLAALYLTFSFFSGAVVHGCSQLVTQNLDEQTEKIKNEAVDDAGVDQMIESGRDEARRAFIHRVFSEGDQAQTDSLVDIPLPVLLIYELGQFFLPLFIALLGFDQISSEYDSRALRFLTIRARRESVVTGRFLSQLALVLCLVTFCLMLQMLYGQWAFSEPDMKFWLTLFFRFALGAWVFCLPYVALTTLSSTLGRTGATSLLINLLLLFFFWLLASSDSMSSAGWAQWPQFVSVWHHRIHLLHPETLPLLISISMHFLFGGLFLGAGVWRLKTRDV
jgi:ABC-2 type transport system permease protein